MPAASAKTEQIPRVTADDPQVLLHPENNDLMVQTGKQVIDACQLNISIELWLHELNALAAHVKEWAEKSGAAQAVYLAPRGARVALFVCPAGDVFDFDLADKLSELRTTLVKNFNVGMVEILQIPLQELDRFVDGTRASALYGGQARTHHTVEA